MSIYDITGWSGGGRRPISHNLRAGQFRGLGGVNVFGTPTRVVINNNMDGNYGYYDQYEDNTPKWVNWAMGGGMIMNFLGQMMQAIFPHRGGVDGRGSARGEMSDAQKNDLDAYSSIIRENNCKVSGPTSKGEYILTQEGKGSQKFTSFDDLIRFLDSTFIDKTPAKTQEQTEEKTAEQKLQTGLETAKKLISQLGADDIIAEIKDGKIQYKYNGTYYDDFGKVINAKNEAEKTTNKDNTQKQQATGTGTYPVNKGETWYEIVQKYTLPEGVTTYQAIGQLKKLNGITSRTAVIGPNEQADSKGNIQIPPGWELND